MFTLYTAGYVGVPQLNMFYVLPLIGFSYTLMMPLVRRRYL